ncbi:MAG: M20/M25/M40 family metallo-hydrolase [Nocardioides sp.]
MSSSSDHITGTVSDDVVELCSQLIAIDTSNYGRVGSRGERVAADHIDALLRACGYEPTLLESEPTRANLVLRIAGADPDLPALLVHGHLDVVPAAEEQWTVPPFAGVVQDGYLWGRGATDMKDMVAMMLAVLVRWSRNGVRPRRDVVFAFVADEEEDGALGAEWLVRHHPSLFARVEAAIGEAGGRAVPVSAPDGREVCFYPVAIAERGSHHLRLRATGTAGHGSRPNSDNPVDRLVRALTRVSEHRWPLHLTTAPHALLTVASRELGLDVDPDDEASIERLLPELGELRDYVEASLRCSTNLTVLEAGYKCNVVPSEAFAEIDVRSLPGTTDDLLAEIDELLGPGITRSFISDRPALETTDDSEWFRALAAAIRRAAPDAVVVPFCMGGGTDAKPFAELGIAGYGFAPLGRDPEGRVGQGMHGVDERVPVASLHAGLEILADFLQSV